MPDAEKDALLAAVRDLLRTADQPTSHSATARVNAGALDRLRAAERAFPSEVPMPDAEIDVTRRLDQIEQTALRVRPTDVGKWAATGKPSAASAVVIAPADLSWLLAMVRATRVPSPGGSDA